MMMRTNCWLLCCLVFLLLLPTSFSQNLRRRGAKRRPGNRVKDGGESLFNALVINYPLHIFNPTDPNRTWRREAEYSEEFARLSTSERGYLDVTRAQDQEDVWLYENWFYGMKNGVIMESGALDGILYSNSLMFESYGNWTAIHVGKIIH